ncbi:MAG: ABC-2 family transporter protein [Fimbriimonadaceae bacterium]|nr:ABC-2 family transporter protein [Fimbriimonadaceae bacterium]
MRRYWKIYKTFFVTSLARELEFRANFFAKILQNMVWMSFFVLILLVVYRNTNSVAGWGRGQSFILAATIFLMTSFGTAFFMSIMEIPQHVRQGTLDFIVTKPIDTQFWISSRKFNFDKAGTMFAGMAMLVIGVIQSNLTPNLADWAAYVILIGASLAIYYSVSLILMTTGIWLVRVDNLWVLTETLTDVSRFPIDIYGPSLRQVLTFVVPMAFIATIPATQLVQGANGSMVALGLLWATIFLTLSRIFWRFALRHYTSASS